MHLQIREDPLTLNRAAGLWGKLEKAVLEKGITKETEKQSKMTVFNGPILTRKRTGSLKE